MTGQARALGSDQYSHSAGSSYISLTLSRSCPLTRRRACAPAGLLSTDTLCDDAACAGAPFAVTLGRAAARDGSRCVVFGRLIRGYGLLYELEHLPATTGGQPVTQVRRRDSGPIDRMH